MTDTSKYMSLLAKVMQEKSTSNLKKNMESYNKLYYAINADLYNQLQKSSYPYKAVIVQKCEDMLETMESIYILPDIIGKRCFLMSNYKTTSIFKIYDSLFEDKKFSSFLCKIYTQIPFIIMHTENENIIEILNYANVRITLTENEFKFLVVESGKRKIALNKVIQYTLIKTKLSKHDLCVISDNIYAHAEEIFSRTLSFKIANIDMDGVKSIRKRHLNGFSALTMSAEVMCNTLNNPYIRKYNSITYEQIDDYVNTEAKPVLYGFMDEFLSLLTQIKDYYEDQKQQIKIVRQDVVGDIVRLGYKGDQTLQSIRRLEENREQRINEEDKSIENALNKVGTLILKICDELGENLITGKQISRKVLDNTFESIFRSKNFNNTFRELLLSRLYSFEYDNYDLVFTYFESISGKKVTFDPIEIDDDEWEKAKMLLNILEPEDIPKEKIRMYVDILGERCTSGKELFAKALVSPENKKNEVLQKSLEKGYEKAGSLLLENYKNGDRSVNIMSLANAYVPEACMILANKKRRHYQRKEMVYLDDYEFTYYKIAAAKQYAPAIAKIIDIIFESRFSSGFQIPIDEKDDEKYEKMISYGHIISQLSRFLISKMFCEQYYSEILGIVLFSLNENLSEAMRLLTNAKRPLAYYCKGNMYEFGGGVSIDLKRAISNYQIAINKGLEGRVEHRLAICKEKNYNKDIEKNRNDYYQSSKSYSSSCSVSGSYTENDGCFAPGTQISMSNGTTKCVEDIKVGDKVLVYDHYNGGIAEEIIIANVHDASYARKLNSIILQFENNVFLAIVQSHVLFDKTDNKYVWIDESNIERYIGHKFAFLKNNCIEECELLSYVVDKKITNYYMPISKFHLNLFAEGILTMPPTKLTVNIFNIDSNMNYNLSIVEKVGITPYEDIKSIVSTEEYSVLPCKYLASAMYLKKTDISDFKYAIKLFRDQKKYLPG